MPIADVSPVSTHSRPKAAGNPDISPRNLRQVSTHSRPKAAGFIDKNEKRQFEVSTHSRPKAAGNHKPFTLTIGA